MKIAELAIIAVIVLFGIPLAAIIGGILLAMLKVMKGGPYSGDKEHQAEETGLIQELHDGLVRMEERVEALETLLLDSDRKAGGGEAGGKKPDEKKAGGKKASEDKPNEDKTNGKEGQS